MELDDLAVVLIGNPRLVIRSTGEPVALLPTPGGYGRDLEPFAMPRYTLAPRGLQASRERIGRIVTRRSSWCLDAADLPHSSADAFEVFSWGQAQRLWHGLPRWLFARPDSEVKPICIDLLNPFSCEELLGDSALRADSWSRRCIRHLTMPGCVAQPVAT